jgi:hypothetical protein
VRAHLNVDVSFTFPVFIVTCHLRVTLFALQIGYLSEALGAGKDLPVRFTRRLMRTPNRTLFRLQALHMCRRSCLYTKAVLKQYSIRFGSRFVTGVGLYSLGSIIILLINLWIFLRDSDIYLKRMGCWKQVRQSELRVLASDRVNAWERKPKPDLVG